MNHGDERPCGVKLCLCLVEVGRADDSLPVDAEGLVCSLQQQRKQSWSGQGGEGKMCIRRDRGGAVKLAWVFVELLKNKTRTSMEIGMGTVIGVAGDRSSTSFAEFGFSTIRSVVLPLNEEPYFLHWFLDGMRE